MNTRVSILGTLVVSLVLVFGVLLMVGRYSVSRAKRVATVHVERWLHLKGPDSAIEVPSDCAGGMVVDLDGSAFLPLHHHVEMTVQGRMAAQCYVVASVEFPLWSFVTGRGEIVEIQHVEQLNASSVGGDAN